MTSLALLLSLHFLTFPVSTATRPAAVAAFGTFSCIQLPPGPGSSMRRHCPAWLCCFTRARITETRRPSPFTPEALEALDKVAFSTGCACPIEALVLFLSSSFSNPFSWIRAVKIFAHRSNVQRRQLAIWRTMDLKSYVLARYVTRLQLRAQVLTSVMDVLEVINAKAHEEAKPLSVVALDHAIER